MPDLTKLNLGWFDHRTDVPSWVASGIGQINVEWSVLERELEELIRLLMDIDIQPGRIIVNWMNAKTRGATAGYLTQAHILNSRLKPVESKTVFDIAKAVENLQTKRDIVAHGLWSKHRGEWSVLKIRHQRNIPELEPDLKKLGRAVLPQPEPMSRAKFLDIAEEITTCTQKIVLFCEHLERELAPLKNIRPVYTRQRRDYRQKPKKKARRAPPRS
jgi:hypothetical protein